MNSSLLAFRVPAETGKALAERLRALRLAKGWTRETLAKRAGITATSLKRFENQGKASLDLILKSAHGLARLDEFDGLFLPSAAQSMAELERRAARRMRRRGSI